MAVGEAEAARALSAADLVAGGTVVHDVEIPHALLQPGAEPPADGDRRVVRVRPLTVATLAAISRAAGDDPSLVPVLVIKEAVVDPPLGVDAIRQMTVGLVHFLVSRINALSGLTPEGDALEEAAGSPFARTHVLLARHFGWTPQQVSALTPGQVAVYLAGIERLLELERAQG